MAEIVVRKARAGDADDLKALLDRSWRTHWAPHLDAGAWARYEVAKPVVGYVDLYLDRFVVAERGGVLVGMYHLEEVYLEAIHVDSWAMGTGIGRALMDAAEGQGATRLEVRAFNTRAIGFYEARGWRVVDERTDTEMGFAVRSLDMER